MRSHRRDRDRVISLHALGTIATLLLLAACGGGARTDFDVNRGAVDEGSSAALEAFVAPPDSIYRVQIGDRLDVTFFTHPEQNRLVMVRPDGRISMPFVGDVQAAGRPPQEIARELERSYANVLVNPRVDVLVDQVSAEFYVFGEVKAPGRYPLEKPTDLLQALAVAGGYNGMSRLSSIVLLRKGRDGRAYAAVLDFREYMDASRRDRVVQLRAEDIVWVPKDAISRWDNVAAKLLRNVIFAEDVVVRGWTIGNLEEVYRRNNVNF